MSIDRSIATAWRRLRGLRLAMLLVLSVAVAVLWVRSYFRFESAELESRHAAAVASFDGQVLILIARNSNSSRAVWKFGSRPPDKWAVMVWASFQKATRFRLLGFSYAPSDSSAPEITLILFVPHWFVALVVWWPTFRVARSVFREHRRRRLGLCLRCGYNLHATPGRCPECGTVPEAVKS